MFEYVPTVKCYVGHESVNQEKIEIEILCSSDSVFSPDSEYGFKRS